jgi:hypothetical protein
LCKQASTPAEQASVAPEGIWSPRRRTFFEPQGQRVHPQPVGQHIHHLLDARRGLGDAEARKGPPMGLLV